MKSKISIILVFALIAAIFIASICFSVNSYYHIETHTVKVEGKVRKLISDEIWCSVDNVSITINY